MASPKWFIAIAFLVALLGCLFMVGALSIDRWQSNTVGANVIDVGLRSSCSNSQCTSVTFAARNCTSTCNATSTVCVNECESFNTSLQARLACLCLCILACALFGLMSIAELVFFCGNDKKDSGVGAVALVAAALCFASIGVYSAYVAGVTNIQQTEGFGLSDSFNLIAVAGAIAVMLAIWSCVCLRSRSPDKQPNNRQG